MAAFEHFSDMYDVALKPRMLRSIIQDQLPNEKQPFRTPFAMSTVVSAIKTHRLLSESVPESSNPKLARSWKSAVDDWVVRLLSLVSSNLPDKCWAGVCLLGVTCQECSSDRFLSSYVDWFHKLLSHLQLPADSHVVKVASLASVSDLFTRLGGFRNVMKDGTSHAGKLIQPCVNLLNEDSSEGVSEEAGYLLCTLLTYFPSSLRRHYDRVEDAIVSKIISGKCSVHLLEKFAHCLALLPKSRGDEDSWFLLMQKILLLLNNYLNNAFQGLEEENKRNEIIRLLVLPGKDPPPPLGGCTPLEGACEKAMRSSEQLSTPSVSSLMLCLCRMLTSAYPVQVTIPVRPLLSLVRRVLTIDGSLPQALLPFMTAIQQEFICSQLPVFHSYSLELLTATIKAVHSQLLPHAADVVRLLAQYINICRLPELRIKVYSVIKILLISMGVGIVIYLAQDITSNAIVDLDFVNCDNGGTSLKSSPKDPTETLLKPSRKKRKHVTTESVEVSDAEAPKSYLTTPISLKIAALEAVESLLTVGGASRSESWRSKIDLLLITVATNACKGGWAREGRNSFLPVEPISTWAEFQLAALRALLASLLSPAGVRPPYLAQGLELFRRGKQETGTKVAEFCAHALLALEILIHPRALPLMDFSPSCNYEMNQKRSTAFSSDFLGGMEPVDSSSEDDDLYVSWRKDSFVDVDADTQPATDMTEPREPSRTFRDPEVENLPSLNSTFEPGLPHKGEERESTANFDVEMEENHRDTMVNSREAALSGGSLHSDTLDASGSKMASAKDVSLANGDGSATIDKPTSSAAFFDLDRREKFRSGIESEDSDGPIPDIVDVDPDSDSD